MPPGATAVAFSLLWEHAELLPLEAELALRVIDRDLVMPAPAGRAVVVLGVLEAAEHPFQRQVREAVHLEEPCHLLDTAVVRDQLFAGGKIDPVKAGMPNRRTGDAQVDLTGAR